MCISLKNEGNAGRGALPQRVSCAKSADDEGSGLERIGPDTGEQAGWYYAGVVKLVDTPDLGSGGASCGGSSPSARTKAVSS